jgi:thiamine-monophosphate kinase
VAKKISDIGEFGLIARIRAGQGKPGRGVIIGIGDDAAAFALSRGTVGVVTIDTLVEGTHFDRSYMTYADIGWKAMAANLSDIAAMAGNPLIALVSLTLNGRQTVRAIDQMYQGMRALADRHGVMIAGGDTVRGREFSVTIAVIGECARNNLGLRSGAKPGDAVLVTGELGASQSGLDLLNAKCKMKNAKLVGKHLRPVPRVDEGLALARKFKLHGMIDISDGLASELGHLCEESTCGIVIDQGALPVADEAITVARLLRKDPLEYCLAGGEEYELLFTLPLNDAVRAKALLEKMGTHCTIIGQAVKGHGARIIGQDGKTRKLGAKGFRHF